MARLFFGLGVEGDLAERIARGTRRALAECGPTAIYEPDDLHLTLAFLGEVDDGLVPSLVRASEDEFRGLGAPELRVGDCAGAFPSPDAPRALWHGVEECVEVVGRLAALRNRALQVAYSHGLRPAGAERRRGFTPHVTVARPGDGARVPADFYDEGEGRRWLPVDVSLYESLANRSSGGARYRVVGSWPLVVGPG